MLKFSGHSSLWVLILALVACSREGMPASSVTAPQTVLDVPYASAPTEDGTTTLLLDIYQSGALCETPRPFVLLLHGGGFQAGVKDAEPFPDLARMLADRGYVAISANYRLIGEGPVLSEEFAPVRDGLIAAIPVEPSPQIRQLANGAASAFEDTVSAVDWVSAHAEEHCIDPSRYAIWGSSAGAVIALHVAYGMDDYGIAVRKPEVVIDYWGRLVGDGLIAPDDPPVFILHGDADADVPYRFALDLQSAADQAGVPYSFYTVPGAGHGFDRIDINSTRIGEETVLEATTRFLDAHFGDGEADYRSLALVP